MKYKYLICLKLFILIFFSCKKSDESKWKDLFIDNSMEGWHIFQDDGKKSGWQVKNNVLTFIGVSDMESGKGDASLLSDKTYYNFEIKINF